MEEAKVNSAGVTVQVSEDHESDQMRQTENRVVTEQSEKVLDPDDYSPIILVPTDVQKHCIDSVVLEVSRVFKDKIINLVEPLCKECNITEPDQVLDSMSIADILGNIAEDKDTDKDFLQKFAYTQTFSFLLEQYLAAAQ